MINSVAVLVLDDSQTEQSIIVKHLNNLGFTDIDVAEDGLYALEHLRRKQYGLLVSGIKMPVIMFTAKSSGSTSWLAGAIAYVPKPFTEADFEKALKKVLGSS
jgi:CheY-like chemotaxis protein